MSDGQYVIDDELAGHLAVLARKLGALCAKEQNVSVSVAPDGEIHISATVEKDGVLIADNEPPRFVTMKNAEGRMFPGFHIGFCDRADIMAGFIRQPGVVCLDEPGDPLDYEETAQFIFTFLYTGSVPSFCVQ